MVSAFNSLSTRLSTGFRGLPIYVGHPDDPEWAKANPGIRAEAVGRIKELQDRDEALFGRVAFNDQGEKLTAGEAPAYSFHSPRWGMVPTMLNGKKVFRPVLLHSIGLTNNPNIPDNVIGRNEAELENSLAMKSTIQKLLAALGKTVAADATDEQLTAAMNEATTGAPALVAASNDLVTARADLATANGKITVLEGKHQTLTTTAANERSARADVVLVTAVNDGRITEAQRAEWKGKLTSATDFAAVEGELKALKPAVNTRNRAEGVGARKAEAATTTAQITAINEAVSKHIKDHGLDPRSDYNKAYAAVKSAQPGLFEVTV
jgi:hypothetical protein